MILLPGKLGCCMSRFGSLRQPWRPKIISRVQGGGFVCMCCVCVFVCVLGEGGLTCWRLTQERVPPLDDQNMSISLRCFNTNPLWGMSETYLYLSLRWRALNRQFISLSHFRLCFLADKWHLLPKPSGWSPLPATTALLGWAPNIHHNTLCLHVCLSDFVCIWFWREQKASEVSGCSSLSVCCLVPKLVTERLCGGWSPNSIQCTHAMQQHNSSVRQNANTALQWPAKQCGIMLSHDTWDQRWQLQIWSCCTFHLLKDSVDYRSKLLSLLLSLQHFWLLTKQIIKTDQTIQAQVNTHKQTMNVIVV